MKLNNNQLAFLYLVRAGLWEKDVQLYSFGELNFSEINRLAEEQSVVGLVAAGIEHLTDVKIPQTSALEFVDAALQIEQRNQAMNHFIGSIIDGMRAAGIYTLLVKGQGIAQCYERPQWRSAGDVDFFLSEGNYKKAVDFLSPLASKVNEENPYNLHLALTIAPWDVELHGTLRSGLWRSIEQELDSVQESVFYEGKVRSWMNGRTQVFLPKADEDVVFIFSHILQHFYKEGIGLRQICDLCRLLWTYKSELDMKLLEKRLCAMGVMSEWKAFGALTVDYLGMPNEAYPFYSPSKKWSRKAQRIIHFIFDTGSFGHNRDYSYYDKYPYVVFKIISFWRHTKDGFKYFTIFPLDSIKLWWGMIKTGVNYLVKGK